jgi:hypothetical protein
MFTSEKNFATRPASQCRERHASVSRERGTFSLFFIVTASSSTSTLKAYQLLFDA